ncbi:ferrous iron transport protein B [Sedimentibacter sp. zth1]|uniref:ferrous iron transport protein B n=1 Tax=Sedimentibacter sp. zth1 TaxID=2816908 RepID=UPI001A931091|nr:ferrous iron transport protein B [Sedimentibacter sp. zth1]QSX06925.1 ferrous iron transport protein B [Sedimentibacter sp. zth1]
MGIKIALVGNPNSGKTTLFNALTGANQYVGNWPGVTVEKKEGKLKSNKEVTITDLPGIYSLSPYTLEEVVSRNYLIEEKPDAIINIVDGTNLERNLYLTTQLAELTIPVIVAINMMDVVKKNGDVIRTEELSKQLGCKVMEISAMKATGINELATEALILAKSNVDIQPQHSFNGVVEHAIAHIEESLGDEISEAEKRWYAIKIFERDEKIMQHLNLDKTIVSHIEEHIVEAEDEMDDDAESIITNERYIYIASVIKCCYKRKNKDKSSTSDKIDKVVTNRFLALPIFAIVMFVVYYISVTTIGDIVTAFTNDTLFGEWILPTVSASLESIGCASWLQGLIVDGIIGGVGAVLGFVPQIFVLFIMLAGLEECGYMSRIAFVLDRIFRKFGLSGKSFIPMLIGTGCGIPGIMASRTIENERDRRMTIMTTTFMPCGAKLPIIALISGALLGGKWWVAPSAYFVGIAAIIVSGIMLKKTKPFSGEPAPFVMELPSYHLPTVGAVLRSMWERGWSFIKKAGTIILLSAILIWFTSTFSWSMKMVENYEGSILESIGSSIAWFFKPLGFGNPKAAVATILGLVAKENVVGTFGILYGFGEVAEDGVEIWSLLQADYSALAGYSFLIFNLLCAPCFAAIGAIKREMNNSKWTWFAIGYQTVFAYTVSLIVYQLGMFFMGSGNTVGVTSAFILIAIMFFMLFRPYKESSTLQKKVLIK